jgi:hypothetical protein
VPRAVRLTRKRTWGRAGVSWISDGLEAYRREIRREYRDPRREGKRGRPPMVPTPGVGLTQAVKKRRWGRVIGIKVRTVLGKSPECPYVVCVERLNGVLRDRVNALTRKTHAFARDARTWDALVTVCLFEHGWLRAHSALRERAEGLPGHRKYRQRSPAMAIGLTKHIWNWEEFLTSRANHYLEE